MCGIAGLLATEAHVDLPKKVVEAALDRLTHRGPDARGVHGGPGFVFGHVRLAIVDPGARADQPMQSNDGALVVTFNGEIFNHDTLRQELAYLGVRFRTASDTEVVLEAWRRWGPDAVGRFRGQFAFAVWDSRTATAHLVRDRVGIKPLYLAELPGAVMFASEAPAILVHPACPTRIDPLGVSSFLSYRHVLGDRSLFQGIRLLRPGHIAQVSTRGVTFSCYWRVSLGRKTQPRPEERMEAVRFTVRDAVRAQLPPTDPTLLLLSGGLDSAILAREAVDAGRAVTAFTAHVEDPESDEFTEARETARSLGADHVRVDFDLNMNDAADIVERNGIPMAMHNEVGMHLLARASALRSKVLLCGEGADEIFSGYGRIFRLPFDHARGQLLAALPKWLAEPAQAGLALEPEAGRNAFEFFQRRYSYFPQAEKGALFTAAMRRATDFDAPLDAELSRAFTYGAAHSVFDAVSVVFLEIHLPGLLAMLDRACMAYGVEARVPFLDERVVDLAFGMPPCEKIAWNGVCGRARAALMPVARFSEEADRTKAVLRSAWGRVLPPGVVTRRKKGFPVPLGRWLAGSGRRAVLDVLVSPNTHLYELFERTTFLEWIHSNIDAGGNRFGRQLWQIYNLELFLRRWWD